MDTTKFDAKRRLCPDGACIGIIGPNGRCSECGRAAGDAGEAAASDLPEEAERVGEGELRSPKKYFPQICADQGRRLMLIKCI